jgi:PhnB protein
MTTVNTYLTFNGNCEEAFDFYKSVFGGEYAHIGKFKELALACMLQSRP